MHRSVQTVEHVKWYMERWDVEVDSLNAPLGIYEHNFADSNVMCVKVSSENLRGCKQDY